MKRYAAHTTRGKVATHRNSFARRKSFDQVQDERIARCGGPRFVETSGPGDSPIVPQTNDVAFETKKEMKMNRKVEIVQKLQGFVGLNKRTYPRFEVIGYVQTTEGGGWTGVTLTQADVPFSARLSTATMVTKTEAMTLANEWFKISDRAVEQLVFGGPQS